MKKNSNSIRTMVALGFLALGLTNSLADENCGLDHSAEKMKQGAANSAEIKTNAKLAKDYDAVFPSVTKEDLQTLIKEGKVVLIDANGTESWTKQHIPGAINFEVEKDNLAKLLPTDKNVLVVAYCGSPKCKAWQKAADAAEGMGYKQIKHFKDGIKGWVAAGLKTDSKTKG